MNSYEVLCEVSATSLCAQFIKQHGGLQEVYFKEKKNNLKGCGIDFDSNVTCWKCKRVQKAHINVLSYTICAHGKSRYVISSWEADTVNRWEEPIPYHITKIRTVNGPSC